MSCVGAACFSLPRRGGGSGPCTAMNPLPHLLRYLFPALLQMSLCIFQPLGSAFTRVPHGHGCSRNSGELGPSPLDFIVTSFWGLAHPPIPVPSGWSPRPREKAPRAGKIWKIKFPLSSRGEGVSLPLSWFCFSLISPVSLAAFLPTSLRSCSCHPSLL